MLDTIRDRLIASEPLFLSYSLCGLSLSWTRQRGACVYLIIPLFSYQAIIRQFLNKILQHPRRRVSRQYTQYFSLRLFSVSAQHIESSRSALIIGRPAVQGPMPCPQTLVRLSRPAHFGRDTALDPSQDLDQIKIANGALA